MEFFNIVAEHGRECEWTHSLSKRYERGCEDREAFPQRTPILRAISRCSNLIDSKSLPMDRTPRRWVEEPIHSDCLFPP
jgi:hypothetical protein